MLMSRGADVALFVGLAFLAVIFLIPPARRDGVIAASLLSTVAFVVGFILVLTHK